MKKSWTEAFLAPLSLDPPIIIYPVHYEHAFNLSHRYGDIMTFHLGPREIIYLNSYDVIREAFVKSGNSFSGRPQDWFWLAELCHGRGKLYSCFWKMKSLLNFCEIKAVYDFVIFVI